MSKWYTKIRALLKMLVVACGNFKLTPDDDGGTVLAYGRETIHHLRAGAIPITGLKVCPQAEHKGSSLMVMASAAMANPSLLPPEVNVGGGQALPANHLPQVRGRAATACASAYAVYERFGVYDTRDHALALLPPMIVKKSKSGNRLYASDGKDISPKQQVGYVLNNMGFKFLKSFMDPNVAKWVYHQLGGNRAINFDASSIARVMHEKTDEDLKTFASQLEEIPPGIEPVTLLKKIKRQTENTVLVETWTLPKKVLMGDREIDTPTPRIFYYLYARRPGGVDSLPVMVEERT